MTNLLGEFECRLDAKARLALPSGLKKQLAQNEQDRFVINRGFEKNLALYPEKEWIQITKEINSLNLYNKKNREFVRYFYRGATELTTDAASRILIPKSLQEYAGIDKDIVLIAYGQRIEIWAKDVYEEMLNKEPEDFATLAEEVMGKINKTNNEDLP
ncbi:MAG: division/cell wall cluster transcriptional repressor MraZ [Bacteroidetes bacterium]|nr:division/cell wall cluster transcriptional repressor MraZ [Bacteroidota bacterium]